jgi:NACalpha-BTF3-like transcription factor
MVMHDSAVAYIIAGGTAPMPHVADIAFLYVGWRAHREINARESAARANQVLKGPLFIQDLNEKPIRLTRNQHHSNKQKASKALEACGGNNRVEHLYAWNLKS